MRIVLDTNVLVSGIFFGGPPGEILHAWRSGEVQFVLSPEILEEYQQVGEELAARYEGADLRPFLDLLVVHAEMVVGMPLPEPVCDDPEDDKFVACAVAANVSYIVSGDKHLLRVSGYQGIEIVRPRTFVDENLGR